VPKKRVGINERPLKNRAFSSASRLFSANIFNKEYARSHRLLFGVNKGGRRFRGAVLPSPLVASARPQGGAGDLAQLLHCGRQSLVLLLTCCPEVLAREIEKQPRRRNA
jgi:hypothetical protein